MEINDKIPEIINEIYDRGDIVDPHLYGWLKKTMGKSMYAASAIQFNVSNNQAFHPTSDEETANQNLTENRARKLGTL